jgi:hypothetical protein
VDHFTAHRLTIEAVAVEPISLNEHKGSALRGALYHALRDRFCTVREANECAACPLWNVCPVCTLVSTLATDHRLGRDAARPYTIQPPLDEHKLDYAAGEALTFGLTLYANALRLFPYVIMALQGLEESGLGRRLEANRWRRGRLHIRAVWAEQPLTGQRLAVARAEQALVQVPDIPITHAQVLDRAAQPWPEQITLELLTPLRLTAQGRLVKPGEVTLAVMLARILDRLESLAQSFCDTPLSLDFAGLVRAAQGVRTVADGTRWVELRSYSTRQGRATPIGGLLGRVTFAAPDWQPFLPWLLWGQFTHVGKDAVKGNGWYRVEGG